MTMCISMNVRFIQRMGIRFRKEPVSPSISATSIIIISIISKTRFEMSPIELKNSARTFHSTNMGKRSMNLDVTCESDSNLSLYHQKAMARGKVLLRGRAMLKEWDILKPQKSLRTSTILKHPNHIQQPFNTCWEQTGRYF